MTALLERRTMPDVQFNSVKGADGMNGAPTQDRYEIAKDTWIIPQLVAVGAAELASINSMVILAAEPVIVDTGTAVNRDSWLEDAFALVEPSDVRWIFLSHGDRDHTGNVNPLLELCPRATVVTTEWGMRYMLADGAPAPERMRWINDGESFPAGDRVLNAVHPPLWDGTGTRGLYDATTGVYWAADSFASLLNQPVTDAHQLEHAFWQESFVYEHRSYAEWLPLTDPIKYDSQVRASERLRPSVVASAHGPVLTGAMVGEAYQLLHRVARMDPVPAHDQSMLEEMIRTAADMEAVKAA
jgi:flavorubredoxin